MSLDLNQIQRTHIADPATGSAVGASFLKKTGQLNLTATAVSGQILSDLEALLPPGGMVLGARQLAAGGSGG